jgi:hypothetical protein
MLIRKRIFFEALLLILTFTSLSVFAQKVSTYSDSVVVSTRESSVSADRKTGRLNFRFSNGVTINNAIAYVSELSAGYIATSACATHLISTAEFSNASGKGIRMTIRHSGNNADITLIQQVLFYQDHPYLLTDLSAVKGDGTGDKIETRDICALAVMRQENGKLTQPGAEPRFLDFPFDNDNWSQVIENNWHAQNKPFNGTSYEYAAIYDNVKLTGLVVGSLSHDFWKTGISYHSSARSGVIDSLKIADGVATEDNSSLPPDYGGKDGTHDHAPHGTMVGQSVNSSIIYLSASEDIRNDFINYGKANVQINGSLSWAGPAPVYWNSFGVEDVLGYRGVMMPKDLTKVSDFINTLHNFNQYSKPFISIDSYDQSIYTTDLLTAFGKFAQKQHQELGFYFIPFALWSWKNSIDNTKFQGTDYPLSDVVLRDKSNQPIWYKDGEWGALALDPTHPAVREYVIHQLQKAKTIGAKLIKIDFLTAGALESTRRYDPGVRSGMQAYNYGMKMLKALADSIMGKDIFITEAISPMFPHQYAHTRFISTDVYSHLRDDQPGFPHYGSTESSLAYGSHLWWVQGTLWPYANLDVTIMKNFQKNPDLSEQEVKVRLFALMSMGSILGDGSDFRNKVAADRARIYLDNKNVCAFFSAPKAFTPLKFADNSSFDQQLAFYLPGEATLLSLFNFDKQRDFNQQWSRAEIQLSAGEYRIEDFMTGSLVGIVAKDQRIFSLNVKPGDAVMVRFVLVK